MAWRDPPDSTWTQLAWNRAGRQRMSDPAAPPSEAALTSFSAAQVYSHQTRACVSDPPPMCRLRGLLRECRRRAEQEPDNEEAQLSLSTLLSAMASNASAFKESRHHAVIAEVLGIKLWTAMPVRGKWQRDAAEQSPSAGGAHF
jgi:hypothetical protein